MERNRIWVVEVRFADDPDDPWDAVKFYHTREAARGDASKPSEYIKCRVREYWDLTGLKGGAGIDIDDADII